MSEDTEAPAPPPGSSNAGPTSEAATDTAPPAAETAQKSPASSKAAPKGVAVPQKDYQDNMATGEIMDRVERKKIKAQKKKEESEAKKQLEDKLGTALKKGNLAKKRKIKTNKRIKIGGMIIAPIILYMLFSSLFDPYKGGVSYGICKVYLETQVRFPMYLKYTGLKDFGDNVRVRYTRVDAFGGLRLETIRCYYKYDEASGSSILDKVTINRREESYNKIERFNTILPVVLKNLPNLDWPSPNYEKNLDNLEIDGTAARQRVL